jgi:hypothetical protein
MIFRIRRATLLLAAHLALLVLGSLRADNDDAPVSTPQGRYGPFGLFDHRSAYGRDVFPEPLLVDDTDREDNEMQLDWFHAKAGAARTDSASLQLNKGFGLLTLELNLPYEYQASSEEFERGVGNIGIGARHPFYQYVSPSGFFDTTFGAGAEVGIPTHSSVSKNTEFVPRIFNDMRFGSHVTLQTNLGYSVLFGPGDDSGLHTLEYGVVLAATFQHAELPLPGVRQFSPLFEISGEKQLNHDVPHQSVLGDIGFRANLKPIGDFQLKVGVGYVFPMNQTARGDVHHGIYTSLIFDF